MTTVNDVSLGSSQQVPDTTSDNWFLNAGVRFLLKSPRAWKAESG